MKAVALFTAAASLAFITMIVASAPHNTKSQDRYADWRRSGDIEDRRNDPAIKGDLAPAGWAVYHRNH